MLLRLAGIATLALTLTACGDDAGPACPGCIHDDWGLDSAQDTDISLDSSDATDVDSPDDLDAAGDPDLEVVDDPGFDTSEPDGRHVGEVDDRDSWDPDTETDEGCLCDQPDGDLYPDGSYPDRRHVVDPDVIADPDIAADPEPDPDLPPPEVHWIVVGNDGTILWSPDASSGSWTAVRTSGAHMSDVEFADGRLIAVGYSGTILVSTDGIRWTSVWAGTDDRINTVTYGAGVWWAGGQSGLRMRSSDSGVHWIIDDLDGPDYSESAFGGSHFLVASGIGTYFATGDSSLYLGAGMETDESTLGRANDFVWDGSRWLAVGNVTANAGAWIHGDERFADDEWPDTSPTDGDDYTGVGLLAVARAPNPFGHFRAVGLSGAIWWSLDGGEFFEWNESSVGGGHLRDIAYGDGLFVAVGDSGRILASVKGAPSTWTDVSHGSSHLSAVAYLP